MQSLNNRVKDKRYITVGEALKAYRLGKGYSAKYIAAVVSLATGRKLIAQGVYNYECGAARITMDYLSDFCRALKINCNVRILKNGAIWLTSLDGVKVSARMY